ncbi:MAG: PAS domain S-box protein [Sphingomonas adhaesiva]|uniref:hybrid sensor histidine kinase/response regulator n=1 Tax=Sphingomonas adhaesiva TaxID=28212 RepID=UPI002FF55508
MADPASPTIPTAHDHILAEGEARFRQMVDTVPQIVWIADAQGQIEFLNQQFTDYTGASYRSMSPAEIAAAFIHPDDAPHVVAAFTAALATGTPHHCEHRIRSATGEYRWFLDRANPYRDPATGEITRWFGSSVDIHDRKAAEEALRHSASVLEERVLARTRERNLLATMIENTDMMVMAVDLDFNILAINLANADEFERVFGVRPRTGDNMLALLADQPEHQAEVRAAWLCGMRNEPVTLIDDFGDPDRARPYYAINLHPLRDDRGRQVGVYQFVTDVTERLRRDHQLADAQEALRQAQKMEAMGQLTGGVAHDFNNLLTPIVGVLDMLGRRTASSEREQRLIAGALQSAERAKTLVQRLLAFARRQPLQPVAVDLAELVAGMGELIASTTGPQINVVVDAPSGLPRASADANQVEMALLNLVVNARDAMPAGGTLRIGVAEEAVGDGHRARLPHGRYLRLGVSDSGTGMDAATLARAIEPFFSTKGVGKGTGLGLSMVHGLALQLGGTLTIASAPGAGTQIELWLPRSAAADAPVETVVIADPATRTSGRVLLVDDEELVRLSTADMLAELGYDVVEASSGEEALGLIERGVAFDLLLTDHLMPGITGAELAALVHARRPDAGVLLISGYAEGDDLSHVTARLTKPFRKDELAAALAPFAAAAEMLVATPLV